MTDKDRFSEYQDRERKKLRQDVAVAAFGAFLAYDRPSTFSPALWEAAVRQTAERAVRAAEILLEEMGKGQP